MGYSQENKMAATRRTDSIDACTNVVDISCNLATESNKPVIHEITL